MSQTTASNSAATYPAPAVPPMPPTGSPARPAIAVGHHARTRGSVFAGVLLVMLGLVFLAAQFVPVIAPWNAWPLVVIVVGFVQMFTPDRHGVWGLDRLTEGLGTAVIGAVLLGNTTGVIPWTMWITFISLWPVLLIAAGVGILGKAVGQSWIRAIAPLLIWATLAYSIAATLELVTVVPQLTLVIS